MADLPSTHESPEGLRRLTLLSAGVYGAWWLGIHWLLPQAFNPLGSRLVVVAAIVLAWAGSYRSRRLQQSLSSLVALCVGLITCHYFYLFYNNVADIDWVVGSFITVTAGCTLIFSERDLTLYSGSVVLLTGGLCITDPALESGIFLPGMSTILIAAHASQRIRNRLVMRLQDSHKRIAELYATAQRGEEARIRYEVTQRALQLREEYIAILAHELKTPLTALKLRTQAAQRALSREGRDNKDDPPAKVEQFLTTHNRLTDRLTRLVDDMLDTSRIHAGKMELICESTDISRLVRECVQNHAEETGDHGELTTRIEDGISLAVDAARLEQVLQNLLINTRKYGRGKPVEVGLRRSPSAILITIEDRGIGIAPEDQERIFERFERAVPARDTSGLGLGLFISDMIVRAHGGHIEVKSALGEGACFTVRLPLAQAE